MRLMIVMATLCFVSLFILLMPNASSHALDQSSPLQATEAVHSPQLASARKFKMLEEARMIVKDEARGFQVPKQKDNHKENVSGQAYYKREQNRVKGRKWGNVADMSSRFFTMDYAHVTRRRPVHNMSLQRP